mgnify:CR=1 FL=1
MKELFKNIKFVWKYSKSEKIRIVVYCIINLIGVLASIIFPFISARIIVNLTSNNIEQFVYMGAVFLGTILAIRVIDYFSFKIYEKILKNTYINIQYNLGAEILKLSNKTLDENGMFRWLHRNITR